MDGELAQISDVARQTASLLASGDDDDKLSQIQAALQSAGDTRAKEFEAQRDILRSLARQYEAQKAASTRPASVPSEEQHQDLLAELDSHKFTQAKQIADLEQDNVNVENKLERVKADVEQAEALEPLLSGGGGAAGSPGENAEILRLTLYRALGFTPVQDERGQYVSLLATSATTSETNSFPSDHQEQDSASSELADFAATNRLWDAVD